MVKKLLLVMLLSSVMVQASDTMIDTNGWISFPASKIVDDLIDQMNSRDRVLLGRCLTFGEKKAIEVCRIATDDSVAQEKMAALSKAYYAMAALENYSFMRLRTQIKRSSVQRFNNMGSQIYTEVIEWEKSSKSKLQTSE